MNTSSRYLILRSLEPRGIFAFDMASKEESPHMICIFTGEVIDLPFSWDNLEPLGHRPSWNVLSFEPVPSDPVGNAAMEELEENLVLKLYMSALLNTID